MEKIDHRIVEAEFRTAVNEFGLTATDICVQRVAQPLTLVSVGWEGPQVKLTYGDAFLEIVQSVVEVALVMRHELCHVLTIPNSRLQLPNLTSQPWIHRAAVEYIDLYREYVAEREFIRRTQNRDPYLQLKRREFKPEVILDALTKLWRDSTVNPHFAYFVSIFRIFYDAIYFHLVGDRTFKTWCDANGGDLLHTLFLYTIADIEHIEARSVDYQTKIDLMMASFRAFAHIDVEVLLRNEIVLIKEIDHVVMDEEIATLWRGRNLTVGRRRARS